MISVADIDRAALWVTGREGPYHNDSHDPGGATAYGLAARYHPELADELATITQQEAAEYLAAHYWGAPWNELPQYLVTPMLAFSVLEGPIRAAECLQRALVVHVDGDVGAQTIHAAQLPKPDALLEAYFGACMDVLHESNTWVRDGTGWERRQFAASLAAVIA